ncbi:twin-arginine translocation signal domain-containing protein [Oligoflexus tunisiensis]|uniref:twin-arginine translocation signal domain-containing protein n=1 Tax=Oligoflexus tunisiensis TaxID=708132 RepID=UPI00114D22B8|nr:twin-arginine translocation signal domain-containing protein [Oligoflexus tunisiensis]
MLKFQESRRNFLKGLSVLGAGSLSLTRPLMAAAVNPALTDTIVQIVHKSYPASKPFPDVVKAFAEGIQKGSIPQVESPAFVAKAWASDRDELALYVTVQFTLSTNYFLFAEGKAAKLSLLVPAG